MIAILWGVDLPHLVCQILVLSVGMYNHCLQWGYIYHTQSAKYQFSVQESLITLYGRQICHTQSAYQILVLSVAISNHCLQWGQICHTQSAIYYYFSVQQSIIPLYGRQICHTWSACQILVHSVGIYNHHFNRGRYASLGMPNISSQCRNL